MSIILIGYRGSGKSTIGRLLASQLNLPFADSDELIVARAAMSIAEIFSQQGESGFRDIESQIVAELATGPQRVIALGGGSLLREKNREAFSSRSHTFIYLRCQPEELHRRIHADPQTAHARPSLSALGGSLEEVRTLLAQREPIYLSAMTFAVNVDTAPPPEIVQTILDHLPKSARKTT